MANPFKAFFITFFLCCISVLHGQEINCTVEVNSSQIAGSDKSIFDAMQKAVYEFVNNRKWTGHSFTNEERISCNILINITEALKNEFKASIQVQATRPVFNTAYNSTLINHIDKEFSFTFSEFSPLNYSENAYTSNLTSVLAYYVYVILGLDYDSFSPNGGEEFFKEAQEIVNTAQGSGKNGWKAFEGDKNRYWLVQNYLDPRFLPLRTYWYNYHRQGFDLLANEPEKARKKILAGLTTLNEIKKFQPVSFQLQFFFNAKSDELVSLFKGAPSQEKMKAFTALNKIDPVNANKYQNILKK